MTYLLPERDYGAALTAVRGRCTPEPLRLSARVLSALEVEAVRTGRSVDDVVTDVLVEQLPGMVAETLQRVLSASARRARPLDIEDHAHDHRRPGTCSSEPET